MPIDVKKIRELRAKLGLTQQQAAARAGLATRYYWNAIECGRHKGITIETLERIAAALGCHARDLLK